MRVAVQITPFWRSMASRAGEQLGDHIGGYRASRRLTAIAERDDYGVLRAGSDATSIVESAQSL
jgi:hypothetical protein